jgi:hypothetical protein
MSGRIVRLFVAAAAASFLGVSAASAGWYGSGYGCCGSAPAPVNWGCASSGCAPVRWGCGSCGPSLPIFNGCNTCGSTAGYGYGYGMQAAYDEPYPVHVAYQGPTYAPPVTGYTYPVSSYEEPNGYPYVSGYGDGYRPAYRPYGYRGYGDRGYGYRGYRPYGVMGRPFYRSRVAQFYRPAMRYPGMRHAPHRVNMPMHAPRRGYRSGWMGK